MYITAILLLYKMGVSMRKIAYFRGPCPHRHMVYRWGKCKQGKGLVNNMLDLVITNRSTVNERTNTTPAKQSLNIE